MSNFLVRVCELRTFRSDLTRDEIKHELLEQLTCFASSLFDSTMELKTFLNNYNPSLGGVSEYTAPQVLAFGLLCYDRSIYSHRALELIIDQIQIGLHLKNKQTSVIIWNVNENKASIHEFII